MQTNAKVTVHDNDNDDENDDDDDEDDDDNDINTNRNVINTKSNTSRLTRRQHKLMQ